MPATTGMKGEGYYDRNSAPQAAGIGLVRDWLVQAARAVPLPAPPQPVVAVDFGSSEGRNAIGVMQTITGTIRQRSDQPIQTVYSDLSSNNFNRLFANLDDPNLMRGFPAEVYPSAVPGSFYRPLLPPGTVHLATCFNAVLWMDRLPARVADHVVYRRPLGGMTVSTDLVAAFSGQAAADWAYFLQSRARDMVPGGKLIVTSPGDDERGRCSQGLYDVLNDACRDLVAAGRVEPDRYERLTVPVYFRTVPELLAPLSEAGSPLRDAFAVERAATADVPTPFEISFQQSGNAAAYGCAYRDFLRAFSEPVVRSALVEPGGDETVLDAIYERVAERVQAEPQCYRFRYVQVAMMLTRR